MNFFQKYVFCCCYSNNEEEQANERTRLLSSPINYTFNDEITATYSPNDEGSSLNKILHKTANNIIDVGASESLLYDPHEATDRAQQYKNMVAKVARDYLRLNFGPHICSSTFANYLRSEAANADQKSTDHKGKKNRHKDSKKFQQSPGKESSSSGRFRFNRFLGKRFKNNFGSPKDSTQTASDLENNPAINGDENSVAKKVRDPIEDQALGASLDRVLSVKPIPPHVLMTCDKIGEWMKEIKTSIANVQIVHKEDFLIQL